MHLRGLGGVQTTFENVVDELTGPSDRRFRHYIISPRGADAQYPRARAATGATAQFAAATQYVRLRSRPSTISHFYNLLASRNILAFNRYLPARHIVIHERGAAWNVAPDNAIVRANAASAGFVVCNSGATAALLREQFGVAADKLKIVLNAIFDATRTSLQREARPTHTEFRIGFLGRLEAHKGAHVALKAFECLPEQLRARSRLLVYGEGFLRAPLEKRFGGVAGIEFMGRTADPLAAIGALDLVVVPSIREPFGNVVAEAGLLGVPVIAANIDGIPEAAGSADNALLLEPTEPIEHEFIQGSSVPLPAAVYYPSRRCLGSPKQVDHRVLCDAITDVIQKYDSYLRNAAAHRRYVVAHMSTQAHVAGLRQIYASMVT